MSIAEQPSSTLEGPVAASGPFKFLDYFADTPEDRRRFGGREREIREIVARIANEWTLVLYGRSGIGKTSLILAGIFPELEARGYRAVYARTLTDPIRDLCRAVGNKCGTGGPEEDLRSVVRQAVAGGPLVIVLDQFEEFFIRFREKPETRTAFIEAVGSLVNDRSLDLTVVFSLREDYIAALDDFRERVPDLFENQYRLRALTAFGVRQAISRPLTDAGISYDEAVVSRLVDQLEESSFDPPVLQIICSELYLEAVKRAKGKAPRISLDDAKKVGDLDDIFRRCLDGLGEAIPSNQALLARMILDTLITGDNTKQAVTVKDLLGAQFSAQEGEVRELLNILVQQRLLRRQLRDNEPWYELIHERLVPHLKKWLDSDPRFYEFRQARDFVETSGKTDIWIHKPEALLNAGVLTDLLGPYKERFRFEPREWELIFRSAVYRHSPDVAFWAQRTGTKEAIRILLTIMASPNERERNGAAIAAGLLSDPEGDLAAASLRLAMDDHEETVRRSAGQSLAQHARKQEILALQTALRSKETRRRARQTLTDLRLGGHPLKDFSWLRRRFAREEAEHRLNVENKAIIRARRKTGAVQGMLASLVWVLVAGVPLAALGVGLFGVATTEEWYQRLAAVLGTLLPSGALLGAVLGGIVASAVARDAVATGEDGRWVRALVSSRSFFYSTGALVATGVTLWYLKNSEAGIWPPIIPVVLTLVVTAPLVVSLAIVLGLLLLWSRAAIWPPESRPSLWFWSLLGGLGTSGFSFAVIYMSLHLNKKGSLDKGWILDLGLAFVIGLAVSISLIAIASSEHKHPIRHIAEPFAWRRYLSRSGAFTGTLVILSGIAFSVSPDMIPVFASKDVFDSSRGLVHGTMLGPRFPDTRYFRICNLTRFGQMVKVEKIFGDATINLGPDTAFHPEKGKALLLPPGCHLGSFSIGFPIYARKSEVILRPPPTLKANSAGELDGRNGYALTYLVLQPTEPGWWKGFLVGQLADSKGYQGKVIGVFPLWYGPSDVSAVVVRVYALARNAGWVWSSTKEPSSDAPNAGEKLELPPLPGEPISVEFGKRYWPVSPDRQGQWGIEFQIEGLAPTFYGAGKKVSIPVELRLMNANTPERPSGRPETKNDLAMEHEMIDYRISRIIRRGYSPSDRNELEYLKRRRDELEYIITKTVR